MHYQNIINIVLFRSFNYLLCLSLKAILILNFMKLSRVAPDKRCLLFSSKLINFKCFKEFGQRRTYEVKTGKNYEA
ncbi:hypothetical protein BpHYR1_034505 [Brachionus plicatilis]|uniref:Uncharacterized protein n=1 Tax=Brachionus plicatilis TaxID=10195 RepID=A0A3M7RQ29_BRAPC|nr:hypothetical protein BpHYR1_034505 [Brachionus plicatilis]